MKFINKRLLPILIAIGLFLIFMVLPANSTPTAGAYLVDLDGAVGPASANHIIKSLEQAQQHNAKLFILRMDTPGGLDKSMRSIIKAIISSSVPVVTYIAPGGARAASAGTYILYASHIAAMAPGTNVGAATPVNIGDLGGKGRPPGNGSAGSQGQRANEEPAEQPASKVGDISASTADPKSMQDPAAQAPTVQDPALSKDPTLSPTPTMSPTPASAPPATPTSAPSHVSPPTPEEADSMNKKMLNDAISYLRSLAELRGRNVDWAEIAVRDAASLSAEQALTMGVIDIIADSIPSLLQQINGRAVRAANRDLVLDTTDLTVVTIEPDWHTKLLATITDPSVAYVLFLIAIYGIFFEFANPGFVVPGVVGSICLLLALYAFQLLPINYTGFALMILGIGFMITEAFLPSFGALGIGGVVAFVAGSILLFDPTAQGMTVAWQIIAAVTMANIAFFTLIVGMLVKSKRKKVVSGVERMVGRVGKAVADFSGEGDILLDGEIWHAVTSVGIKQGQAVRVLAVKGLVLQIEPIKLNK